MAASGAGILTLSGDIAASPVQTDGADVNAAALGDTLAFERLYRRHSVRIHNLARRMMGAQDADELTQDVFVRAWHKLGTFRGESAFGTSLKVAPRRPGLLGRLDTSTGWRVTDQTVPVKKGARLDVNEVGGDIIVRTWDRDAVRIKAQHSRTDSVKIDSLDTVVRVRTASTRGRSHAVDFEITAPAWMPLTLGGQYADVTVEGAQGDVTVETVHGDINVRGGSGFVSLKTVHGVAVLEGAKGRSEVRSVNEAVRVIATSGDTYAESNNGRITFEKMDAKNVEASAVNGDIVYEGAIHRDGVYRLSTHNGNIVMGVTNGTNATINVRTFSGGFNTSVQAKVDEVRKNRRYVVTLGNGSGRVDLESFGGSIRLRRPDEIRIRSPRERQQEVRSEK